MASRTGEWCRIEKGSCNGVIDRTGNQIRSERSLPSQAESIFTIHLTREQPPNVKWQKSANA